VITACRSPIRWIANATLRGSPPSTVPGRPVFTAQNPHERVHVSPRIMNVAVPRLQHSPMFGQRASSQTVWSAWLRISSCSSPNLPPVGKRTLSQGGRSGCRIAMLRLWPLLPGLSIHPFTVAK